MEQTRRAFFATLFAPLLTKLLPAPKHPLAGQRVFSDELLRKVTMGVDPAGGLDRTVVSIIEVELSPQIKDWIRFQNILMDRVMRAPSMIILESTSDGVGDYYRKLYMERNRA